jgi:Zn-dependent protease
MDDGSASIPFGPLPLPQSLEQAGATHAQRAAPTPPPAHLPDAAAADASFAPHEPPAGAGRLAVQGTLEARGTLAAQQGIAAGEDPFGRSPGPGRLRKRLGSAAAALAALAAKFWAAVKALLIALPKVKFLATGATALVSVAAYTLFFGLPFAIGLVVLLFVHEMGHVIQLRREGVRASAPMFVPLLGAFIAAKSLGENALAEARVGIAGPILGTLGSAAVALVAALMAPSHTRDLLLALAYFGFFINLLNLIPVVPFDGGRVMAAVAPGLWFVGVAGLVALVVVFHNPFLGIFIVLALFEMPRRWRELRSRTLVSAAYYRVPRRHRIALGLLYIALVVALVAGMDATHVLRSGGHGLTSL